MEVEENDITISVSSESLAAKVYRPKKPSRELDRWAFAVIAHPWGMLGGSMNDRVVINLASAFLTSNPPIPVVTFSSRGVFPSTGKSSWWGCEAEKTDYEGVVEWAMRRIGWLNGACEESNGEERSGEGTRAAWTIYCCGYSHGALLAPYTPSHLSQPSPHYRYILISPPLGVAWFLHPFRSSSYDLAVQRAMQQASASKKERKGVVLVLHTTSDQFTSPSTYASWTKKMKFISSEVAASDAVGDIPNLFVDVVVEADHFWATQAARDKLVSTVHEWL